MGFRQPYDAHVIHGWTHPLLDRIEEDIIVCLSWNALKSRQVWVRLLDDSERSHRTLIDGLGEQEVREALPKSEWPLITFSDELTSALTKIAGTEYVYAYNGKMLVVGVPTEEILSEFLA